MTVSILDFKEWYAQPWEVASPTCIIEANRGRNMLPMPNFFGQHNGPALPVLEHVATSGFGGMKLAFVKKVGKQIREVVHFPLAALPCDPAQRFDALFQKKERWTQS